MSVRAIRGKSKYQKDWEAVYTWAKPVVKDVYSAHCSLCSCTISVDTMGRSALKSHANGSKHKQKVKATEISSPMDVWINRPTKSTSISLPTSSTTTSTPPTITSDDSLPLLAAATSSVTIGTTFQKSTPLLQVTSVCSSSPTVNPKSSTTTTNRMTQYLLNQNITKAETIWAIQTVMTHTSLRTAASSTNLFQIMFPDSDIAKRMMLQKDKLSYMIVHGLCPYFKGTLEAILKKTEFVVLGFDESLNKISQKQQMDLGIRFWCPEENRVTSRFLTSAFLNHTSSEDLLQAIKQNLSEDILEKVCQLSMDGPNVNHKLKRMFLSELRSEPESPQLLDLGSCGLHTIHNAFKTGIQKTGWELIEFFRAAHNLFKFAPARRGDYTLITGSSTFPLQMCSVRWVENGRVAKRMSEIYPSLEKYVEELKGTKKEPSCNSFSRVVTSLKDKLLRAKIAFFESLCDDVEGFLREFQTDSPMSPFLHGSISVVLRSSMSKIVKDDVMKENDLNTIDVLKKDKNNIYTNLKLAKNIDLGYGTRAALRKCIGNNDRDILTFKLQCRTALQFFVAKIMEKSPLKYPLTRALTFLNPQQSDKDDTNQRLRTALDIILVNNLLSADVVQRADREFKELTSLPVANGQMKSFDRSNDRLDDFWSKLLKSGNNSNQFPNLEKVVKLLLTLSHGNANIERGFSINKEILIENLKEQSLVAQRVVYDAISHGGGIEKVEISTKMIQSVRASHSRYREALEEQKKMSEAVKKEGEVKRKRALELDDLKNKKQRLLEETYKTVAQMDERLKELKE